MSQSFFVRWRFTIVLAIVFLGPFILRGTRLALRGNRNDIRDWLPSHFPQTADHRWFQEHFPHEQFVLISAPDAQQRGIVEGDRVQVANGRGAFKGVAHISDDVNPGIVVATLGYWRQLNQGTVNSISSAEFTDMGHTPSFSDKLVEVTRSN